MSSVNRFGRGGFFNQTRSEEQTGRPQETPSSQSGTNYGRQFQFSSSQVPSASQQQVSSGRGAIEHSGGRSELGRGSQRGRSSQGAINRTGRGGLLNQSGSDWRAGEQQQTPASQSATNFGDNQLPSASQQQVATSSRGGRSEPGEGLQRGRSSQGAINRIGRGALLNQSGSDWRSGGQHQTPSTQSATNFGGSHVPSASQQQVATSGREAIEHSGGRSELGRGAQRGRSSQGAINSNRIGRGALLNQSGSDWRAGRQQQTPSSQSATNFGRWPDSSQGASTSQQQGMMEFHNRGGSQPSGGLGDSGQAASTFRQQMVRQLDGGRGGIDPRMGRGLQRALSSYGATNYVPSTSQQQVASSRGGIDPRMGRGSEPSGGLQRTASSYGATNFGDNQLPSASQQQVATSNRGAIEHSGGRSEPGVGSQAGGQQRQVPMSIGQIIAMNWPSGSQAASTSQQQVSSISVPGAIEPSSAGGFQQSQGWGAGASGAIEPSSAVGFQQSQGWGAGASGAIEPSSAGFQQSQGWGAGASGAIEPSSAGFQQSQGWGAGASGAIEPSSAGFQQSQGWGAGASGAIEPSSAGFQQSQGWGAGASGAIEPSRGGAGGIQWK